MQNRKTEETDTWLCFFFHGKLFIVKKHGKKTLKFELKQAGKNLHLTVTLKVLICQDSSCIRPRQIGKVLAALGAQLLCIVPCQGGAEWLCTKYDISVFHIATNGKRAVSCRGNRWQEELTYQKTLHISLSLVFSASPGTKLSELPYYWDFGGYITEYKIPSCFPTQSKHFP